MSTILRFASQILTIAIISMTAIKDASMFADSPGVVVMAIDADSPAMKVGLKTGDILLSYDGRPLPSIDALQAAQQNIVGKKEITLRVRRGEQTLALTMPTGRLGIVVLPNTPMALTLDKEIESLRLNRKFDEVASSLAIIAKELQESGHKGMAGYVYARLGTGYELIQKWQEAQEAYTAGWIQLERSNDAAAQAKMLEGIGRCHNGLNDYPEARQWFEKARAISKGAGNEMWIASNLITIGGFAMNRGKFQDAFDYYSEALKIFERLMPGSVQMAAALNNLGNASFFLNETERAEKHHLDALKISERHSENSSFRIFAFNNLGNIAMKGGRLQAAEKYYLSAKEIIDQLPSDTPVKVANLTGLGNLYQARGDLQTAENYHQQSLAISRKNVSINPRHIISQQDVAMSFNNLGNIAFLRGDLKTAKDYQDKALEIRKEFASNPLDLAVSKSSLGNIAYAVGDLQKAEKYYREALDIAEGLGENLLEAAGSLNNLGLVAEIRGDLEAAQYYFNRALDIKRERKSGLLDEADSFTNLGNVAFLKNDFKDAEKRYSDALKIRKEMVPGSLNLASSLCNLGNVKLIFGDWQTGQSCHSDALAIYERLAPNSLEMAISLNGLGNASRIKGDLKSAQNYHSRALAIQRNLAPGSLSVALTLNNLGLMALDERRLSEALQYYNEAVKIIESQRQKIFSPDTRALFIGGHQWEYYGLLRTHIALDDLPAAFATIERARARTLVDLIFERRVGFPGKVPEFIERQEEINRNRSAAYYRLKRSPYVSNASESKSSTGVKKDQDKDPQSQLMYLNIQQRELEAEIRRSVSQKFANLEYPQPLYLKGVQDTLDPGTLLLTYFVGYQETYLFAVTKTKLKMLTLKLSEKEIHEQVRDFRDEVSLWRIGIDLPGRLNLATTAGKKLYDGLIRPVQMMVDDAERILICPDGPLQVLPFSALVYEGGARPRYLIDVKPLHTIVSMAVYKEAKQRRANNREPRSLLAFGNPLYSGKTTTATRHHPLPGTLKEVQEIGKIFGNSVSIYLGKAAREAVAKQKLQNYTIIHFATHGLFDYQNGLDSALALSEPEALGLKGTEEDNGYLQAWEIFNQPELKADLVVLSACNVGLGRNISGEGLVGLTRAFQYAGAKSVAISLWDVSDESAVLLITTFYKEIQGGASKDVALQRATAAVRSNPKWRHPYYWAPFLLTGDWK